MTDLPSLYQDVAKDLDETAGKYARGEVVAEYELPRPGLSKSFDRQRAAIARAVEESSKAVSQ